MSTVASSYYFSTVPNPNASSGMKHCILHGYYLGWLCPSCNTAVPPTNPTVSPGPDLTESLVALIQSQNQMITDLLKQLTEKDRLIEVYRNGECPNGCHRDERLGCSDCPR